MPRSIMASLLAASAVIAVVFGAPQARADAVADFYKGKTLTILLGTGPGRTYDLYARLLGSHLVSHIPGEPGYVVQYMQGAGGLKATNYLYNAAPRDGTMIGTLFGTLPGLQLFEPDSAKYDSLKFNWLGSFAKIVNVIGVTSDAPATTLEQAKEKEVIIGSIGRGNSTYQFPALINSLFGTKFKIVSGYPSGGAIYKAMESGEVHGYAPVWLSLAVTKADWVRDGKVKVLVQGGLSKIEALPDVPLLLDLARNDEEREMIRFVSAQSPLGRAAVAPPGVPADRLAALEKAFVDTMKDPAFLAEAKAKNLSVSPSSKEEVVAAVEQIINTPAGRLAKLKTVLGY